MPSRRLTFPAVAVLAIASLALGVIAALADGRDNDKRHAAVRVPPRHVVLAAPAARPVPPTAAIVVASGGDTFLRAAVPAAPCPVDDQPPAAAPVPQNLLDAFGVLRRDRAAADELPTTALRALRQRGLEPFDPAAARLLRQTDDGGRAWVVPVRDVRAGTGTVFELRCVIRTLSRQRQALAQAVRARRRQAQRARPNVRRTLSTPVAPASATPPPATEPAPVPTTPAPAATVPTAPNTTNKPAAHPGLAIIALGGAPAGAGGRLEDLVRGREDVALDPCGGPNHNMLSVSGIVPDGVGAAFLTSPDGTAIRADVKDNAYAFVVPRSNRAEQRYVVWTGGDGTPHVQPLAAPVFLGRIRCPALAGDRPPIVSPDDSGLCGHFDRAPAIVLPATPVPRPRTPAYRPPTVAYPPPCALASQVAGALPVPPTVRILPKTRRAPKRHG